MASLVSVIRVPGEVVFCETGEESVLLNQQTGRYYGLDETGTRMWQVLARHRHVEGAYRELLAEYDVEAERLRRDLLSLIDLLAGHALLDVDPS
jgi:hypothetical protein